jgi:hypothetical protein
MLRVIAKNEGISSADCLPSVLMSLRVGCPEAARGTARVKVRSSAAMFLLCVCVGVWGAAPGSSLLADWRNIQIFLQNVGEWRACFRF